jgi:hypothetical protein
MAAKTFSMPFALQLSIGSRYSLPLNRSPACCALWQIEVLEVTLTEDTTLMFNNPGGFFIDRLFAVVALQMAHMVFTTQSLDGLLD